MINVYMMYTVLLLQPVYMYTRFARVPRDNPQNNHNRDRIINHNFSLFSLLKYDEIIT